MASMLSMASTIALYEEIWALSRRMVEAARANDWDTLIDLERGVAALRDTLMGAEESDLSEVDAERKRALIRQILDDDAEVRRHTEPWMEHVRQFLGASNRRQQIQRAYGAARGPD